MDQFIGGTSPLIERSLLHWNGYRFAYGAQASVQHYLPEWRGTLRFNARWREFRYDDQNALNGDEKAYSLAYRQSINDNYLLTPGIAFIDYNTQRDFTSYTAWRPSLELIAELSQGVIGSIATTYELRNYNGLFPWVGEKRNDKILNLTVGATFKKLEFAGLAPMLEYTYSQSNSNIGLYKYDNHGLNIYLTKDF